MGRGSESRGSQPRACPVASLTSIIASLVLIPQGALKSYGSTTASPIRKTKQPHYRVVATMPLARTPVHQIVGTYNPLTVRRITRHTQAMSG